MAFDMAEANLARQVCILLFMKPAAQIIDESCRISLAEALHHIVAECEIVEAVTDGAEDIGACFGESGGIAIVFALLFAVVDAPLSRLTAGCLLARKILKALFFALVAIGVAAQIYSVLAPMAIMAEAMLKVDDAKRQADDLLNRIPPEEDDQ